MCFNVCGHENVGKEIAVCAHRGTVVFYYIVLFIKLERIFFEDYSKHFSDRNKKRSVFFTFLFSIKFITSVASLRCGFRDYDISCSNVPVSTKEEVLSVRPSNEL